MHRGKVEGELGVGGENPQKNQINGTLKGAESTAQDCRLVSLMRKNKPSA